MTYFTDNPIERLMVQKPEGRGTIQPAPRGALCAGCRRYGPGCLIACVRETEEKEASEHEAGDS